MQIQVGIKITNHLNNVNRKEFGNISSLPTEYVLRPIKQGELVKIQLGDGSHMDVKLIAVSEADLKKGTKTVVFDVNGWVRTLDIQDKSIKLETKKKEKATSAAGSIGSPMTGTIVEVNIIKNYKGLKDKIFILFFCFVFILFSIFF